MATARRARVLHLGATLFAEGGFETTSMRAIADAAATTPARLYQDFGDKDGLLAAIAEPLLNDLDRIIDTLWPDLTRDEERAAIVQSYIGALLRHRPVARVVLADRSARRSTARDRVVAQQRRLVARLVGPRPTLDEQVRAQCAIAIAQLGATELFAVPAHRLRQSIVDAALESMRLGPVSGPRVTRSRRVSPGAPASLS